ncbi:hypothetical protein ACH9EU_17605 [Kocuria sp. M1R5S2]
MATTTGPVEGTEITHRTHGPDPATRAARFHGRPAGATRAETVP